jgi:hypothetical protein
MPSSSAVRSRNSEQPRKNGAADKRPGAGWQRFLPLLICVVIAPFAVRGASILALEGPKPFALLYPWVEVIRSPVLNLSADLMSRLSQWMLYLQFPLYGLLMTLTFRADNRLRTFNIGLMAHLGGIVAAVTLAYFAQ